MLWRNKPASRLKPIGFIDPCLPTLRTRVPDAPGWIHEIKHDGYRLQVKRAGERVRLFTRRGVDWTDRYPLIVQGALRLRAETFALDGEAVWCGEGGISDFDRLHARAVDPAVMFFAFDLLELGDEDLRRRPLLERKTALQQLLGRVRHGIRYVDHMDSDGGLMFDHACRMGLEGIVSKRADSAYRSGKSLNWIKVKNPMSPAMLRIDEGA